MPSNHRVRDTHLPHIRLLLLAIRTICFTLFAGAMVIHEAMVPIVLLAFFAVLSKSCFEHHLPGFPSGTPSFAPLSQTASKMLHFASAQQGSQPRSPAERWLALSLADTWEDGQAGESLFNFHCPFVCRRSPMLLFSNSLPH